MYLFWHIIDDSSHSLKKEKSGMYALLYNAANGAETVTCNTKEELLKCAESLFEDIGYNLYKYGAQADDKKFWAYTGEFVVLDFVRNEELTKFLDSIKATFVEKGTALAKQEEIEDKDKEIDRAKGMLKNLEKMGYDVSSVKKVDSK